MWPWKYRLRTPGSPFLLGEELRDQIQRRHTGLPGVLDQGGRPVIRRVPLGDEQQAIAFLHGMGGDAIHEPSRDLQTCAGRVGPNGSPIHEPP